ncbi:RES family NAD+ phosphorylase [Frigoribacterium faeni]|uniref:RES family NAD+ phosphorylase n=1 Tax=Frigoribacterium faeni TaxID=145483 RepID=UPI001FAB70A8|nr:RES family NAD+ phosphorylase [Frigoribacterium faeni]MCJ0700263.1 RES family NAD+ phosphorylase [Frigoribacterium faeni]
MESHSSLSTIPSPPVLWRVGYAPAPWNWTDWAYADHGRFNGRWDSPDGSYRTLYAGTTLRACLVEVLAPFRPSPTVVLGLDAIEEDEADRALHPTADAGLIPESWFAVRRVATAEADAFFCDVLSSRTIAALWPSFHELSRDQFHLPDFDASTLLMSAPRELTQQVGRHIYSQLPTLDGIRFVSRHGVDHELWALFERSGDAETSARLRSLTDSPVADYEDDVAGVCELFGLSLD